MEFIKKLQSKFKEINSVSFEKEQGLNFLRIELNLKKLEEITFLSKQISVFLDSIDNEIKEEYMLDIFSSGTDKVISIEDIKENTDKNLRVFLKEKIKNKEFFEGKIIDFSNENLTIKWNSKGQFLKEKIDFKNIKKIKLYAKAK